MAKQSFSELIHVADRLLLSPTGQCVSLQWPITSMDGTNMHVQATQIYLAIKGNKQPYLSATSS